MSSAQLRSTSPPLSVYQTARALELYRDAGRALQVEPSRIEEMVRQGRQLEVAEALMERLRDVP